MTLGNMRANGARSLDVSCWNCHHRAIRSVARPRAGADAPPPLPSPAMNSLRLTE
jgi:hypothetical protein